MEEILLLLGGVTFLFALVSSRFENSLVTPPMLFTGIGVAVAWFLTDYFDREVAGESLEFVAELTLVIVLFIDASRIDLPMLIREHKIPVRLLGIGLPLTALLGAVIAKLLFGQFSIWEAAVLAAILAPTDAALGQAVVSSTKVPVRIRQALNVESGLNDGVILPLVMLFAALGSVTTEGAQQSNWLHYWILQVTLGPLVGIVVGFGGGYALSQSKQLGWLNRDFTQLSGVALAIVAWAGAIQIGGNGFIAAFVGGMCISCYANRIGEPLRAFGEAEGQLLALATFLLFGMTAVIPAVQGTTAIGILYAVLSLTVIRMLPATLSLFGLGLQKSTLLFLGWFGPRGLASLLFGILVLKQFDLPHAESLISVVIITVLLSMILHGISAIPGVSWYAKSLNGSDEEDLYERTMCKTHSTQVGEDSVT